VNKLDVRLVKNKKEYNKIINIRETVFIKEQNVPKEIEMDEFDKEAEHFIAYLKDKPIGCARTRKINNYVKLERIAILKEYRGKGYGRDLTNFLINLCRKKGFKEVHLHSQINVSDFYEKLGFKKIGGIFLEADIEHIEMIQTI